MLLPLVRPPKSLRSRCYDRAAAACPEGSGPLKNRLQKPAYAPGLKGL